MSGMMLKSQTKDTVWYENTTFSQEETVSTQPTTTSNRSMKKTISISTFQLLINEMVYRKNTHPVSGTWDCLNNKQSITIWLTKQIKHNRPEGNTQLLIHAGLVQTAQLTYCKYKEKHPSCHSLVRASLPVWSEQEADSPARLDSVSDCNL